MEKKLKHFMFSNVKPEIDKFDQFYDSNVFKNPVSCGQYLPITQCLPNVTSQYLASLLKPYINQSSK